MLNSFKQRSFNDARIISWNGVALWYSSAVHTTMRLKLTDYRAIFEYFFHVGIVPTVRLRERRCSTLIEATCDGEVTHPICTIFEHANDNISPFFNHLKLPPVCRKPQP